jgi:hypothetical protein
MGNAELNEFLTNSGFSAAQQDEIRNSADRNETYQEAFFWQRFSKVQDNSVHITCFY